VAERFELSAEALAYGRRVAAGEIFVARPRLNWPVSIFQQARRIECLRSAVPELGAFLGW
jgi:hypothetical protein